MARPLLRRVLFESLESRRLLAHVAGHNPGGGKPNGTDPIEIIGGVLTIVGSRKPDRISISSDGTNVTATVNKTSETMLLADFTSISINGDKGNDRITIDSSLAVDAAITGGAGNDRIRGGAGIDTITGDAGNDWLWGGDGDDVIDAGAGNDHVFGELGNDELAAGDGNDAMDGGEGDDILDGGDGHDRLKGGLGDDQLFGGDNKDHLYGGDGNDFLDGGDNKDHLFGGEGDDTLLGGAGNDHLNGGPGTNQLDGGEGNDKLTNGTEVDLGVVLAATLVSPTAGTGTATYAFNSAAGSAEFELTIIVSGAVASTPLTVTINTVEVGTLTTEADGSGTLVLSAEDLQLAGVSIEVDSTISVGDLTGVFAVL